MKYLVTGGAGFIGSYFVKKLFEWDPECSVVNLDKLSYAGDTSRLEALENSEKYTFVKADITDHAVLEKVMRGVNVVFHFAAETHVDKSLINPSIFFESNASGTSVLLEVARKHQVEKFIHVSTDEVYGSKTEGDFAENDRLNPTNPYSISKAAAEMLALNAFRIHGMPIVITRGSNTYGPYQYPEKVIPLFVSNLMKNMNVPLYGDGKHIRDWLHVEDHCSAIYHIFKRGEFGQIYNIAGNKSISNLELTKRMLSHLKLGNDRIDFVQDREGHDRRYSLDGSRMRKLGWSHQFDFETAFTEVLDWYLENQAWLDKIRNTKGDFTRYYKTQYVERSEA